MMNNFLIGRLFKSAGIFYSPQESFDFTSTRWLDQMGKFGEQAELVAYLSQLEEEGFAQFLDHTLKISWETVYQLLKLPEHESSLVLLDLPPIKPIVPNLTSLGGLTDSHFSIRIADWRHTEGTPMRSVPQLTGGLANCKGENFLLPEHTWLLLVALESFWSLPPTQKTSDLNRRHWAKIRQLAIPAKAGLDNFLRHTVVLNPQNLKFKMRKSEFQGTKVVEVIPEFDDSPQKWLERFDGYNWVQDRYDISEDQGIVQVLIEPSIKKVLEEVKRMPGRRIAGRRAEAFLRNPFSLLGEIANEVIEEKDFEDAREEAGIFFHRFTSQVQWDDLGACGVSLLIQSEQKGAVVSETYPFTGPDNLKLFIRELEAKISQGMQCCAWEGWDLELLGDADEECQKLRDALAEWVRPRKVVHLSNIYNLSFYSGRIEKIGQEKTYYSPYIAKQKDDEGWFPDNINMGVFWPDEETGGSIGITLTPKEIQEMEEMIAQAKTEGKPSVTFPGVHKPVSLMEAEQIIFDLGKAYKDVKKKDFNPPTKDDSLKRSKPSKLSLVVKPNVERVDYIEKRERIALARNQDMPPKLPNALKQEAKLKDYQLQGLAWLQQLYAVAPQDCRGVLLADDMGLGKTLQILALIVKCFEENPQLSPALIVAPVSLLENWKMELQKFFLPSALKVETLYGDTLREKRARPDEIDDQLIAQGLTRFLRPNWRGDANLILTTYETLRDLEFSLASEHWSIMVCDEAQKIKNANTMVTRAAKKQQVDFKIACTGTPVENSLADLWCLFDFFQPGLLGALNNFGSRYRRPIEAKTEEQKERVEELRKLIEPQLIRRTKYEVARDLPQKFISPVKLPISTFQKSLYSHVIDLYKSQSSHNHLGLLYQLRMVCADPRPIGQARTAVEPFADYEKKSPKMGWLLEKLKTIKELGEKVLIFTELRLIQRTIQSYISENLGMMPDIINGDTSASQNNASNRQNKIDSFQETPGFSVLILSPFVAGFGLNIQAANHVIHYTRAWNPAKEDQATDRAYRIGQNKDVFVYCPTIADPNFKTFEEKLDLLLEIKRDLSREMLNGTGELSAADFSGIQDVDNSVVMEAKPVTISYVTGMTADAFEVFCWLLWGKMGFIGYRTKGIKRSGDGGVDVVAISGNTGVLFQIKSSLEEGKKMGWAAISEVVAGEKEWQEKHLGVSFEKYGVTNQFFNNDAIDQANRNNVKLINQSDLVGLIEKYPITNLEIEKGLVGS